MIAQLAKNQNRPIAVNSQHSMALQSQTTDLHEILTPAASDAPTVVTSVDEPSASSPSVSGFPAFVGPGNQ